MKLTEIQDPKTWDIFYSESKFDRNVYEANLLDLSNVLNKFKVPFYLAFGTLLGALREHDFIVGDTDVDIMVMEQYKSVLVQALLSEELRTSGLNLLRANEWLASVGRKHGYIDCYIFRQNDDGISRCWSYWIETERIKNHETIEFLGKNFNIPRDPESYLSRVYGNWKVKAGTHASS